jgi:hypothetical protein
VRQPERSSARRAVIAVVLVINGKDDNAPRVMARDVERLFDADDPKVEIGDGVTSASCAPADDVRGLGSPWRCDLSTDSEGDLVWFVAVGNGGRYVAH